MSVWAGIKPQNVFYFFEEICKIPHGSGNTGQVSDYLVKFAKKRGLEHYQDELGNVIIVKEASSGYEDHEPVMLQGHMDMVTVKEEDCELDLLQDGLRLLVEDDSLKAEGTSLGGDDGIALAYGLALLDGTEYRHPRLELVITVDEEVGMNGARALDVSPLKSRRLINLDSEEEGILLAGCAGGVRVNIDLPCQREEAEGIIYQIRIDGLLGGHSGSEIHTGRGNAICLLGRLLKSLLEKTCFQLVNLTGGDADNVIPNRAEAELLVTGYKRQGEVRKFRQDGFSVQECTMILKHIGDKLRCELREELAGKDGEASIMILSSQPDKRQVFSETQTFKTVLLLNSLPYGVQAMSAAVPGLVETSLNPGILRSEQDNMQVAVSVRSSLESAKWALVEQLKSMASLTGAETELTGDYPGWVYREESPLRKKMVELFRSMYGRSPQVEAIHAGVECGLLVHKMPGLDCVSIGPDIRNIHTTEEELSISSTARVWEYLVRLLEEL